MSNRDPNQDDGHYRHRPKKHSNSDLAQNQLSLDNKIEFNSQKKSSS